MGRLARPSPRPPLPREGEAEASLPRAGVAEVIASGEGSGVVLGFARVH